MVSMANQGVSVFFCCFQPHHFVSPVINLPTMLCIRLFSLKKIKKTNQPVCIIA